MPLIYLSDDTLALVQRLPGSSDNIDDKLRELAQSGANIADVPIERKQLDLQLSSLYKEIEDKRAVLKRLHTELLQAQNEIDRSRSMRESSEILERRAKEQEERNEELNRTLRVLDKQIEERTELLKRLTIEHAGLTESMKRMNSQSTVVHESVEGLKLEMIQRKQELATLDDLVHQRQIQLSGLDTETERRKSQVQAQVTVLERRKEELEKLTKAAEAELTRNTALIERTERELTGAAAEVKYKESEKAGIQRNLAEANRIIEEKRNNVQMLEQILQERNKELSVIENNLQHGERQLNILTQKNISLERELKTQSLQLEQNAAALHQLEIQLSDYAREVKIKDMELQDREARLLNLQAKYQEQSVLLAELRKTISEKEQLTAGAERAYIAAKETAMVLEKEAVNPLQTKVSELEELRNKLEWQSKAITDELEKKKEQLDRVERLLTQSSTEEKFKEQEYLNNVDRLETVMNALEHKQAVLVGLNEEIQVRREELTSMDVDIEKKRGDLVLLISETEDKKSEKSKLLEEFLEIQKQIVHRRDQVTVLDTEYLIPLQEKVTILQETRQQLERQCESLSQGVKVLAIENCHNAMTVSGPRTYQERDILAELDAEVEKGRSKLQQMEHDEEIRKANSEIQNRKSQLMDVQRELQKATTQLHETQEKVTYLQERALEYDELKIKLQKIAVEIENGARTVANLQSHAKERESYLERLELSVREAEKVYHDHLAKIRDLEGNTDKTIPKTPSIVTTNSPTESNVQTRSLDTSPNNSGGEGEVPDSTMRRKRGVTKKKNEEKEANDLLAQRDRHINENRQLVTPKPIRGPIEYEEYNSIGSSAAHYKEPGLKYLRVKIYSAKNVPIYDISGSTDPYVHVKVGMMEHQTTIKKKTLSPEWNEELVLAVLEERDGTGPLEGDFKPTHVTITLRDFDYTGDEDIGYLRIPLDQIPGYGDNDVPPPPGSWHELTMCNSLSHSFFSMFIEEKKEGKQRINRQNPDFMAMIGLGEKQPTGDPCQLRVAIWFDVGYKEVIQTPIGKIKVDITSVGTAARANNNTRSPYAVVQYGHHWVRLPTYNDNIVPYGRMYSFSVYEPSSLLTIAVFDDSTTRGWGNTDKPLGHFRIRVSTLKRNTWLYATQPLLVRYGSKVKKRGEVKLAVYFECPNPLKTLARYCAQPLTDRHYYQPLKDNEIPINRFFEKATEEWLKKQIPPIKPEVVKLVRVRLVPTFDLRITQANIIRIKQAYAPLAKIVTWFDRVCEWQPFWRSLLINIMFILLILYPQYICSLGALALFGLFIKGYFKHNKQWKMIQMDPSLFGGLENGDDDELEEEKEEESTLASLSRQLDEIRVLGGKAQNILGTVAGVMEKIESTVRWSDPLLSFTLTLIFAISTPAVVFAPTVLKPALIFLGLFMLRHPILRDPLPPPPVNIVERLPTRSDQLL